MHPLCRIVLVALLLSPRVAPAQTRAADAIRQLYASYAWETNDQQATKRTPLFAETPAIMGRYLEGSLIRAVLKDRACEEQVQGICNLDFEPMWDSQDPGGATVEVQATQDPTVVRARILYPSSHETRVITYRMRKVAGEWRVADMAGAKWPSLRRLLQRPGA
jgi:hypothetical protein